MTHSSDDEVGLLANFQPPPATSEVEQFYNDETLVTISRDDAEDSEDQKEMDPDPDPDLAWMNANSDEAVSDIPIEPLPQHPSQYNEIHDPQAPPPSKFSKLMKEYRTARGGFLEPYKNSSDRCTKLSAVGIFARGACESLNSACNNLTALRSTNEYQNQVEYDERMNGLVEGLCNTAGFSLAFFVGCCDTVVRVFTQGGATIFQPCCSSEKTTDVEMSALQQRF